MKTVHRFVWAAAGTAAALVAVVWPFGAGDVQVPTGASPAALIDAPPPAAPAKKEVVRGDEERRLLGERLAAAVRGEGADLRQTLQQLGRHCGGLAPSACVDGVLAALPAAERLRLSDILTRLPLLGPHLSALVMTTRQPLLERIDAVSQARAQVLGSENARLLFGHEEAQWRYRARLDEFIEREAAGMPFAQRMAAAQALRPHGDAVDDSATERARRYELTLRLSLLDAKDVADRDRLTREVRSRFFTPEQVERMAQGDRFDAQQRDRMAAYARRKQAIQERYSDAGDPAALQQRDAELAALRQEVFPDSFQPH